MGSRVIRSIGRGYLYSQGMCLYSRCAATIYSSPKSALASSTPPAYGTWQPKPFCPSSANRRYVSASSASSKVLVVNSDAEFSNALSKSKDDKGLTIAYFTATWCGPCRTISPIVDNLSTSYSNVTFMKLDIDQQNLSDTLKNSGVTSVPTFHFYKNGAKVADLIGADPKRLKEMVGNLSD